MPYITGYCNSKGIKMDPIVKSSGYMSLILSKDDKQMAFRDVMNYSPPCSLDRFLQSWEASFTKSIFPYQLYSSVEELHQSTEFPAREDFFNSLKQVNLIISLLLAV